MGSVSVSSCRCCMFVSCVHPVAVLNAAFCIIRSYEFTVAIMFSQLNMIANHFITMYSI